VIKLVLSNSVEHEIDVVVLARDTIAQACIGEVRNRLDQLFVILLEERDGLLPGSGTFVSDRREVFGSSGR
jgi:hypothetical protein